MVNPLMKASFRKIFTIGLGAVVIASFLVPVLILAQADNANEKAKGYCARLSVISSKIDQRITNRDARLEAKRIEIADRIEARQNERDARILEKRVKWDTNRAEHFAKMQEKAGTDEKKQAVVTFRETVTAAIAARRAAVDSAIQDFRQGISQAIASRKSSADAVVSTFQNSVQAAFKKAQSDCDNDVDPRTVRENLRADLKTARETLASDRQDIEKLQVSMESLIAVKREAVKTAIEDFKAVVEQARADFKTVLPQKLPEE